MTLSLLSLSFFFFNDTATTEIYTLSLHDALPIRAAHPQVLHRVDEQSQDEVSGRSEEHTSELQSHLNLVCRLLLEKKKQTRIESNIASYAGKQNTSRSARAAR